MLKVTSIHLHSSILLDFDKLKLKGWSHPKGLADTVLTSSLVKQGRVHTYQIVRHIHRDGTEYQEIFFHPKDNYDKVLLRGKGKGLDLNYEIKILEALTKDLEGCEYIEVHLGV